MKLIHRTNYWGHELDSSGGRRDNEVDMMDAIWVQVVKRGPCCPNFGERNVRITTDHLRTHHDGLWNLFFVSGTEGRDSDHYFSKFVLIPHGKRGFGKDRCKKQHGWTFKGSWNSSSTNDDDDSNLKLLLENAAAHKNSEGYKRHHIHVGISLDTCHVGKGNLW